MIKFFGGCVCAYCCHSHHLLQMPVHQHLVRAFYSHSPFASPSFFSLALQSTSCVLKFSRNFPPISLSLSLSARAYVSFSILHALHFSFFVFALFLSWAQHPMYEQGKYAIKLYRLHDATSVFIEFFNIKHSVAAVLLPSNFSFLLVCFFFFFLKEHSILSTEKRAVVSLF